MVQGTLDIYFSVSTHTNALYIDLEGDGVEGWWYLTPNLSTLRSVRLVPSRKGTFRLVLTSYTKEGCSDRTGLVREVVVR